MKSFYTLLLVCICLMSCKVHVSGTDKNEEIKQSVRSEISVKVDEIVRSFQTGELDYVKNLFIKGALTQPDLLDSIFVLKFFTAASRITKLDEFKVTNPSPSGSNKVTSTLQGQNYDFVYGNTTFDSYLCLMSIENPGTSSKILLSLLFAEGGNDWKLQYMYVAPYTYKDSIAPYFYDLAYKEHMNKNIVGAYLYSLFASCIARPAGNNFHYHKEAEMMSLYNLVNKKFNDKYPLPVVINNITTKPEINTILPLIKPDRIAPTPVIKYYSRVLNDLKGIEKENAQLHAEIETIFPGLRQVADSVIYEVSYINNDHAETKTITKNLTSDQEDV